MNNKPICHPDTPENGQQIITLSGTDYTRLISIMEQHADLTHSPRDRHILRILKHNQPIQEQSDRNRLAEALTSGACCIDSKETLSPYI